jgi:hypothetical protein
MLDMLEEWHLYFPQEMEAWRVAVELSPNKVRQPSNTSSILVLLGSYSIKRTD